MKMKKRYILILLGLLLFYANSPGQLEHFLPDSNAYFSVSHFKFWFQGDTVLYDKAYKKVYIQVDDEVSDFEISTYYAAVREDTLNEKIYCIHYNEGVERLITDFSLQIGETVKIFGFWLSYNSEATSWSAKVYEIDSIEIAGSFRRRIGVGYNKPWAQEYWIDGIGSMHGLFFSSATQDIDAPLPLLLCIHSDSVLRYQTPGFDDCYDKEYVTVQNEESSQISIYPSPAKEHIILESDDIIASARYRIINPMGRIALEGIFESGKEITLSRLTKGVYIIIITDDQQIINVQKFVKN